jgi:hypothetical protein
MMVKDSEKKKGGLFQNQVTPPSRIGPKFALNP